MSAPAGESRHERCRFGTIGTGEVLLENPPRRVPTVLPQCSWKPAETLPRALSRWWGGHCEPEKDCVACPCFEEIKL